MNNMNARSTESIGNFFESDANFNEVYPLKIRMMAGRHWTPIHITKLVADFLATDGGKILDIGSGVGKFCLAGAHYAPNVQFFGIEQREYLIRNALRAQKTLDIKNVLFLHGNFTQLDLREYDHFYFFNSFYENIDDLDRIDESIEYSDELYDYYVRYLHNALQQMPNGTKVVTLHSLLQEIPKSYKIVESHQNGELNFWIKK